MQQLIGYIILALAFAGVFGPDPAAERQQQLAAAKAGTAHYTLCNRQDTKCIKGTF